MIKPKHFKRNVIEKPKDVKCVLIVCLTWFLLAACYVGVVAQNKYNICRKELGLYENFRSQGYGPTPSKYFGRYEGQIVNGLFHGKGKFTWGDNSTYEGDWYLGMRHGKGKRIYQNKNWYEGDFIKDKKQGRGTFVEYTKIGSEIWTCDWINDTSQVLINGKKMKISIYGDIINL